MSDISTHWRLRDVSTKTFVVNVTVALLMITLLSACANKPKQEETDTISASVARKSIRFYSANKLGQEDRLPMLRNTKKSGCQSVSRFRKAYRIAVIGFKACTVYSEPNCPDAAAIVATWDGRSRRDPNKQKPTIKLTVGTSWIIGIEGARKPNIPIRSWSCS